MRAKPIDCGGSRLDDWPVFRRAMAAWMEQFGPGRSETLLGRIHVEIDLLETPRVHLRLGPVVCTTRWTRDEGRLPELRIVFAWIVHLETLRHRLIATAAEVRRRAAG